MLLYEFLDKMLSILRLPVAVGRFVQIIATNSSYNVSLSNFAFNENIITHTNDRD